MVGPELAACYVNPGLAVLNFIYLFIYFLIIVTRISVSSYSRDERRIGIDIAKLINPIICTSSRLPFRIMLCRCQRCYTQEIQAGHIQRIQRK